MSAGKKTIGRPSGRMASKKILMRNIPQAGKSSIGGQRKKTK